MKKKIMASLLTVAMTASMLVGCGGSNNGKEAAGGAAAPSGDTQEASQAGDKNEPTDTGSEAASGDAVTIKLFSNLPDSKNGQGLVEQMITIEVKALDEEAYKTKFKAYAMDGMPDVVSIWGQPSFLDEVLDAGVLAELNEDDYIDYEGQWGQKLWRRIETGV